MLPPTTTPNALRASLRPSRFSRTKKRKVRRLRNGFSVSVLPPLGTLNCNTPSRVKCTALPPPLTGALLLERAKRRKEAFKMKAKLKFEALSLPLRGVPCPKELEKEVNEAVVALVRSLDFAQEKRLEVAELVGFLSLEAAVEIQYLEWVQLKLSPLLAWLATASAMPPYPPLSRSDEALPPSVNVPVWVRKEEKSLYRLK